MTQEMIIPSRTPTETNMTFNPYQQPAMIPTPMQQPVRVFEPLPFGANWGRPSAEVYGAYAQSEVPIYQPHLHQQQQMYEPQIPFEYSDGYDYSQLLADHKMEIAAASCPAKDARQDRV
jgi:hypothetical protein